MPLDDQEESEILSKTSRGKVSNHGLIKLLQNLIKLPIAGDRLFCFCFHIRTKMAMRILLLHDNLEKKTSSFGNCCCHSYHNKLFLFLRYYEIHCSSKDHDNCVFNRLHMSTGDTFFQTIRLDQR